MRLIPLLLIIPISLFAQQGSGARALTTGLSAAPAPIQRFLLWDSKATNFAVYTGLTRQTATNRTLVYTNRVPWVSNQVYAVAALVGRTEYSKSYWPSNAIYVPVAYTSSDMVTWKKVLEFPEVTNTPMKFLRMVNEFKRFE